MVQSAILERPAIVRRGRRLEYLTKAWNALEGLVAVIAGVVAGSISLAGFGIDSFIEVTSGSALLWRKSVDADSQDSIRAMSTMLIGVKPADPATFASMTIVFFAISALASYLPARRAAGMNPTSALREQ